MKSKPNFGDWVIYTHTLQRIRFFRDRHWCREWVPVKLPSPQIGIYLGPRSLQKGFVVYGDYETPTEWHQTDNTAAALVAVSLRKNAVYVDLNHMEIAPRDLYSR